MSDYNRIILMGRLTREPEVRFTPKGTAICKIGVAINRKWKDAQTGEQKEETTFVDADAFGKIAELIGKHYKKGSPILFDGRLRTETWEDKQTNQKRSKLGVVIEGVTFLPSNSRDGDNQSPAPAKPANPHQKDISPPGEDEPPF